MAHSIYGIEVLEGTEGCLHGELVDLGTIVSLLSENCPEDEINEVFGFCDAVGLPISIKKLGG